MNSVKKFILTKVIKLSFKKIGNEFFKSLKVYISMKGKRRDRQRKREKKLWAKRKRTNGIRDSTGGNFSKRKL